MELQYPSEDVATLLLSLGPFCFSHFRRVLVVKNLLNHGDALVDLCDPLVLVFLFLSLLLLARI